MAATPRKFLVPLEFPASSGGYIDLNKQELRNAVVQNLGSAPGSPAEAQIYYDTTSDSLFVYGGAAQPGGGGAGFFNYHPKALLGVTNTWTANQTFNTSILGNGTIALTGTGASSVGGVFTAVGIANSGLTGATTATRYVGGTSSGAPGSGTFSTGDFIVTTGGDVWICTAGGSPGTWSRVGSYLLGTNNTWTGTNTFNNTITGNSTINLTGTSASSVGGTWTATALIASGLTGATQASRYVGATASGAPASGTFVQGDFVIARDGAIWVCTAGGTPGTWAQIGATGTVYNQNIKANNGTALTQRNVINFINGTFTTATAVDNASQSDIKFDVTVGTPVAVTFSSVNDAGSGTALARANHVHTGPTHDGAAHSSISISNLAAPTGHVSWGSNTYKITGLATPTADNDAATKAYVDSVASGLDVKQSVLLASSTAVTVTYSATGGASGRGQMTAMPLTKTTVDAGTSGNFVAGDRVLLKDQATAAQNGIWVVTTPGSGSNGVWDRAADFDSDAEVTSGAYVWVETGTVNADSGWILTTDNPITIGGASGTSLTFSQFSGAGQITAGSGLTKTGNTINVGAGTGITVNADDVAVRHDGTNGAHVPLLYTTLIGNGSNTDLTVTHNLSNQWVHVQVVEVASLEQVECDVEWTSSSACTVKFGTAPASNAYRAIVYG